jgi:ribonucleotide reductase alpha subunit
MKFVDSIGYYVGQKGRIPAMLFSLNIKHPSVEEFIESKSDYSKIQNANISVQITEDFYKAVEEDSDWDLIFEIPNVSKGDKIVVDVHSIDMDCVQDQRNGKWYKIATHDKKGETIVKTVKAKKLMELIAQNMHSHGEPGIQNIDIARKYSNSDYMYDPKDEYDSRILSTNACCLTIDTKILTDKGWKSMGEVYEIMKTGEKLLAMSYNIVEDKYELKEILNSWQKRNDLTVTLTIEDNGKKYEIECSSDHPILTKNRGYVRADSLTVDDDIMIHK